LTPLRRFYRAASSLPRVVAPVRRRLRVSASQKFKFSALGQLTRRHSIAVDSRDASVRTRSIESIERTRANAPRDARVGGERRARARRTRGSGRLSFEIARARDPS